MDAHPVGAATATQGSKKGSVREVAHVFLKLGTIAFGGPAAHIAMMYDEACLKRRWVSENRAAFV